MDEEYHYYKDEDDEWGPPEEPPYNPPRTPGHLSKRAGKLWRSAVADRVTSPEKQALLLAGLEALDRADQARAILDEEGITIKTGKDGSMTRIHPAVRIEKDARSQFSKIWGQLHLNSDPYRPG